MEDYLKDKILFIFSLICKVFKYFLCKPFTWLYEIYVIIKRKYITTPKIKNRIINDLEYNCKKTNVLLKLKEGLETIKKREVCNNRTSRVYSTARIIFWNRRYDNFVCL
jgi:hypothetical protein